MQFWLIISARLGMWWDISIFRFNRGPQILQSCAVGELVFIGSFVVDFCTGWVLVGLHSAVQLWVINSVEVGLRWVRILQRLSFAR